MRRRACVVVLDACGAGALPDAASYGDEGTNTLAHLARAVGGLELPTLARLGLGAVTELEGVPPPAAPVMHGRLHALGPGKDSTAGHRELMGVVAERPAPTYPDGFPPAVIAELERAFGRAVIGNRPANGVHILAELGSEHMRTGAPILYTSQDSVLQVAAHVEVIPEAELYELCGRARAVMSGAHAVGRVIARPFTGSPGTFARIPGRKDLALPPAGRSYLEELGDAGVPVHAVGKVAQLFAGVGIDVEHPAGSNPPAIAATDALLRELDGGLIFTNLVDTDEVYGHRKDVHGFHAALRELDGAVARWLELLGPGDLLVLTADHGCDPTHPLSDHTREYAPLLAAFPGHGGRRHDGPLADVGATVLRWLSGRDAPELPGTSFA